MKQPQIDFKFAKNWKTFMRWHDAHLTKAKVSPMWSVQQVKIQQCFEPDNPGIVNWKQLWSDFKDWSTPILKEKDVILWSEQKRQIETLMLNQLKELNQEQFVLVYLYKGKPEMDTQKMTYWEALHTKKNLMGDMNGVGGDENIEKVSIVNLKSLID